MQSHNERRERTKRKLLWNFLENPGFQLSPIPEEARSSSSSPDSLPELLVEPEPNRHDHDPEYYAVLERRMRNYYRQLFLGDKSADFNEIENEFEYFKTSDVQAKEISYDSDKDDFVTNDVVTEDKDEKVAESDNDMSTEEDVVTEENSADLDKNEDDFEANDIELEENNYDSDKDDDVSDANDQQTTSACCVKDAEEGEAKDVVSEENSADLDKNENEFEANHVVLEENNYDSDKDDDVSDAIDQQTTSASCVKDAEEGESKDVVSEENSADFDKNENEFEANDAVSEENNYDSDKDDDVSEANDQQATNASSIKAIDLVTKENGADLNKNEDDFKHNDVVLEENKYDSDKDDDVSDAEDQQTTNASSIKDVVMEENRADLDKNENEFEANDVVLEENNYDSDKDDNVADANHQLITSASSVNDSDESDIELNKNIKHDDSKAQEYATMKSLDSSDLNKRLEDTDEELSKAKSASDSDESGPCHIISSTVVEIHESRPPVMRRFEDVSPVLVPKFVSVSGVSVPDDTGVRKDSSQCLSRFLDVSDKIIERASSDNANEIDKDKADIEEPGTVVQRLLSVSEVTNVSQKPQSDDEESIAADEFHSSTLNTTITERTGIDNDSEWNTDAGIDDDSDWDIDDTDDNSFEIALRRGIFERKNFRKSHVQKSDEEMDTTDEDVEPVEEIRAPREFGDRDSLHKVSSDTEGTPALAFETQANADKLEEVSSDSHEINASLERGDERKSIKDPYQTPPVLKTNVINVLDDIWSVSPMEVDIEQILKETSQNKKRKLDPKPKDEQIKRKKREDVAIQTSLNHQNWEDIKTNFFVGKPLVLRLCGCQDHVCSKQTY